MSRTTFCRLPVGAYYKLCRGQTGYKKVSGPKKVRGKKYTGGAVEMLLGKAPYYPVRKCPCVVRVTRGKAIKLAEAYQASKRRIRRAA